MALTVLHLPNSLESETAGAVVPYAKGYLLKPRPESGPDCLICAIFARRKIPHTNWSHCVLRPCLILAGAVVALGVPDRDSAHIRGWAHGRLVVRRRRGAPAKWEQSGRFQGLSPQSQGRNLALTVLCVPTLLEIFPIFVAGPMVAPWSGVGEARPPIPVYVTYHHGVM